MSNARDNRIKQLEEHLSELRKICDRQKETIYALQDVIADLNTEMERTLVCVGNTFGEQVTPEDGTTVCRAKFPEPDFYSALDNFKPHVTREDGQFVITVAPKAQEEANAETV